MSLYAPQATELKCGGLVVGCTFDHRVADAYSTNRFLVSWAEAAQSKPISLLPSFRRSLFIPRRPGNYHPSIDGMYVPLSDLQPPAPVSPDSDHLISRIYYITADQLNLLQSSTVGEGSEKTRRTKLESFSAFLWKMIAESTDDDKKVCKMGIVVDGRTRLSDAEDDEDKVKMISAYFGNVLSIPFSGKRRDELMDKPLSWVADALHNCLQSAVTKEHFLGLIDWVEARRPATAVAKIYSNESDDGPACVVSSGQRFPVSKVDFGWGKPAFGSYHFPWGGSSAYVMPMPSPKGNGDWVVYMHLLKGQLEMIEARAGDVFRPLTFDYIC